MNPIISYNKQIGLRLSNEIFRNFTKKTLMHLQHINHRTQNILNISTRKNRGKPTIRTPSGRTSAFRQSLQASSANRHILPFVFSKLNYIKGRINKYRGPICVGLVRSHWQNSKALNLFRLRVCVWWKKWCSSRLSVIILHSGWEYSTDFSFCVWEEVFLRSTPLTHFGLFNRMEFLKKLDFFLIYDFVIETVVTMKFLYDLYVEIFCLIYYSTDTIMTNYLLVLVLERLIGRVGLIEKKWLFFFHWKLNRNIFKCLLENTAETKT